MCLGTSHITVAAVTEQPMFSSFRKTLFCLLYAADEVRIALFQPGFLVYGDTYRTNYGWCFLVWSSFRHTEATTASGIVFRTYETHWVFRFPSEKWSLNLVHLSYMVYCLWGINLPQRLFCFSSPNPLVDEYCSGRKIICFLVWPSNWLPFLLFYHLNSLLHLLKIWLYFTCLSYSNIEAARAKTKG